MLVISNTKTLLLVNLLWSTELSLVHATPCVKILTMPLFTLDTKTVPSHSGHPISLILQYGYLHTWDPCRVCPSTPAPVGGTWRPLARTAP